MDHNKLWKILKETRTPDYLISLLRSCMQNKMQQLEPDIEQRSGSKLGKEYIKAVCCHPAYLLLQRVHHVKCRMNESQVGNKITGRNINNLRYADDTNFMAENKEELKSLLMKRKEESKKLA